MYKFIRNEDNIFASSFNRTRYHLSTNPCCFITAFRFADENGNQFSKTQNRNRNKSLESDIKSSGLSFIKCTGGFIENYGEEDETTVEEDTFCVIDNKYSPQDFKKLCISWCNKYDQDAVLLTFPNLDESGKLVDVVGQYYDKSGNSIGQQFTDVSLNDVEEYFTEVCGKRFVMSSTDINITDGRSIYSAAGRVLGSREFKTLYPEL